MTTQPMTVEDGDVGGHYGRARERMTALVSGLDPQAAAQFVPACPAWTVKDLIAHLTGVCDDLLTGNLEGVGTDAWTAAHVERRRGAALPEVLDEWASKGVQVEAMAAAFPPWAGAQLLFDTVTHEHDLRGALDAPGARDSQALHMGLGFALPALARSLTANGLPALRLRVGAREDVLGDGEPAATLTTTAFELLRALSGRRSSSQLLALDWEGEAERYLPAFEFGPFSLRAEPLRE